MDDPPQEDPGAGFEPQVRLKRSAGRVYLLSLGSCGL